MADLWQACEEGLAAEWDARWRELAPGADLLEAVFDVNGLRFDKGRDPALIARAMGAAPVELAELVREIVAGP
jgi:hypothetical protein